MGEYRHNATLSFRQDLNPELMIFRVLPDDDALPDFEPGQYTELAVISEPDGVAKKITRRQYSIASAEGDPRGLEFYVVLVPEGYFTPQLWKLQEGARLWMNTKCKGKFTLAPVPAGKRLVLVSTGTGIAPYISMLRTHLEDPPWSSVVVVHGVRYERDLGYRDELEALAAARNDIVYLPATTREEESSGWRGLRGRLQTVFQEGHFEAAAGSPLSPAHDQVFLCGNPAMIEAMQALLEEQGFRLHKKKAPGNLHLEKYW